MMKFPIIIDSGANFHMFKEFEFFKHITPATGKIILGDGKSSIPIQEPFCSCPTTKSWSLLIL